MMRLFSSKADELSKTTIEMVEGLHFRVTADELRSHLRARSTYHADRARAKEAELPNLQKSMGIVTGAPEGVPPVVIASTSNRYSFDPQSVIEQAKSDIENHKRKTKRFSFLAEHVYDSPYALTESELREIEFYS